MISSDAEGTVTKLEFLHPTDSHFQDVVKYKTNFLFGNSTTHNGKMVARTGKFVKRTKTLIKLYKFDDKEPFTIPRFL